jgi:UDP-GlcNAc:undecaprenyl-phosphate GlcNAc-1-phosphate transferase
MAGFGLVIAVAAVTAWAVTPIARALAFRIGVVDQPGVRKVHREPIPYLGGLAVLVALVASLGATILLARDAGDSIGRLDPQVLAMLGGAVAMFVVGLVDDLTGMRARHKLFAQLAVAGWMYAAGIRIDSIPLGSSWSIELGILSLPVTLLWIAGVTNAINLIDGLDGLASGIGAIAAGAIAYVAHDAGQLPVAITMLALCGSLLGFLGHNHHPARIFLGDSGSLLIGFLLATSAVAIGGKQGASIGILGPFLALGLPILDMCFAMLRRAIERRGIFSADRSHVHHRLMALGYAHARTVHILWAVSGALTVLGLSLLHSGSTDAQRVVAVLLVLCLYVIFFRAIGAVRIRDSFLAVHAAAQRSKVVREHQAMHDELQLYFREAKSIDQWWAALVLTAERLGLQRMDLAAPRRDGTVREWHWSSTGGPMDGAEPFRASLPIHHRRAGPALELKVSMPVDTMEHASERVTILARLLDRHSIANLGKDLEDVESMDSAQRTTTS